MHTGGHLRVRLIATCLNTPDQWPDMTVRVEGNNLHAPMVSVSLSPSQ